MFDGTVIEYRPALRINTDQMKAYFLKCMRQFVSYQQQLTYERLVEEIRRPTTDIEENILQQSCPCGRNGFLANDCMGARMFRYTPICEGY